MKALHKDVDLPMHGFYVACWQRLEIFHTRWGWFFWGCLVSVGAGTSLWENMGKLECSEHFLSHEFSKKPTKRNKDLKKKKGKKSMLFFSVLHSNHELSWRVTHFR